MVFPIDEKTIADEVRALPQGLKTEAVRTLLNGLPTAARLHVEDSYGFVFGCFAACDSPQHYLTECLSLATAVEFYVGTQVGPLACLPRFGLSPPSAPRAALLVIMHRTAKNSLNGWLNPNETCLMVEANLRIRPALAKLSDT